MKSLILCHLMLIFFCANILAAQQSDNSKNTDRSTATAIEVMTVSHSKTIKSLDDVRTSDNVLISSEQIVSAQQDMQVGFAIAYLNPILVVFFLAFC